MELMELMELIGEKGRMCIPRARRGEIEKWGMATMVVPSRWQPVGRSGEVKLCCETEIKNVNPRAMKVPHQRREWRSEVRAKLSVGCR